MRVDARNWPTSYTLDALNRTSGQVYIDGTRVTNTWDSAGQQLTSADSTGLYSFIWDNDSRKIATQNPTGINLTNTLDGVGNRLVLQDNYGVTSYAWDIQSRLTSIQNPANERTTITWDSLDREQHRVLGYGGAISHTWDAAGRETLIENRDKNGVGQFIASNTYSVTNNRLTVLELDGTRVTFGYDAHSQLISEARSGANAYNTSYVWDANGNRIKQYESGVLTTRLFNAANELTLVTPASGAPTTNLYDSNGNETVSTTGSVVTTRTWDPENRLASKVVTGGATKLYTYSDDGLRKSLFDGTNTTKFTYDEVALLLETDIAGNLQARYTGYPGIWGGLASQRRGSTSSFYGYDSQGSTRILVSSAGVITDSYSWKAFGEELQSGSGTVNPFGYIGLFQYYTDADGNVVVFMRIVVPADGRFMQRDPIGFDGGQWNLYVYVGNNPGRYVDPSGHQGVGPYPPNKAPNLGNEGFGEVCPDPKGNCAGTKKDPTGTMRKKCVGKIPKKTWGKAFLPIVQAAVKSWCGSHPDITPQAIMCMIFAESNGNPNTPDPDCPQCVGRMHIQWPLSDMGCPGNCDQYGVGLGTFTKGQINNSAKIDIDLSVWALCNCKYNGNVSKWWPADNSIGWGTSTAPNSNFCCCMCFANIA